MRDGLLRALGIKDERGKEEVREINLADIQANPFQPRKNFGAEELAELAASISEYGVLQPVVVRRREKGYELVAGERRVRAAQMIGLNSVPAIVKNIDDRDLALLALVENLQREDLGPFEEAEGYQRLLDQFGWTQGELARRLGKSQSSVANKLRLLKLPKQVQDIIVQERISERHARALLRLADEEEQVAVLKEIRENGLSVRATDELVAHLVAKRAAKAPGEYNRPPRVVRGIFKDMRIFLNSFRQAVETLQKSGFQATMEQMDNGEFWEIRVRIAKNKEGAAC